MMIISQKHARPQSIIYVANAYAIFRNGNPANTRRWTNAELMLSHRLRRWANINSALVQRLVLAGLMYPEIWSLRAKSSV